MQPRLGIGYRGYHHRFVHQQTKAVRLHWLQHKPHPETETIVTVTIERDHSKKNAEQFRKIRQNLAICLRNHRRQRWKEVLILEEGVSLIQSMCRLGQVRCSMELQLPSQSPNS